MLRIVEKSKIWISLSLIFIIVGLGFMFTRGLNFGIDFKGGTQVVFDFGKSFDKAAVDKIVKGYAEDAVTNTVNGDQYEIKSSKLDSKKVNEIFDTLKKDYGLKQDALVSQNDIGSSIGKELTRNTIFAIIVAFVAMLIYIAIRFEFKFGVAALTALIHDILVTLSVYAIFNIPVNAPFIAAILTIIGYSINDTIVIFDRIRENSKTMRTVPTIEVADKSLTQTMSRSINTTLTTLITIIAVNVFVPAVRDFSFPLVIGIATGAYSSIFIASPTWVWLKNKASKKKGIRA
ncbi:protein translocase subunit SecF [Clostridium baratii]|uniref:protein translocase subunit SecF n=1 Tax=Clostridium baratii TaxID=1561 RepID=UPI0030D34649